MCLSNKKSERTVEFELVLDNLGEVSRKQGFALAWMLSRNAGNSMVVNLNLAWE